MSDTVILCEKQREWGRIGASGHEALKMGTDDICWDESGVCGQMIYVRMRVVYGDRWYMLGWEWYMETDDIWEIENGVWGQMIYEWLRMVNGDRLYMIKYILNYRILSHSHCPKSESQIHHVPCRSYTGGG